MTVARACAVVPAFLLALALILPLLVPQMLEASRFYASRAVEKGSEPGIQRCIVNMLLPYPLARNEIAADDPIRHGYSPISWADTRYMGKSFYAGSIFFFVACLILLFSVTFCWKREMVAGNIWLILALVTLMLALGSAGILYDLMRKLPVLEKIRGPFKLLGYLHFFTIIGAGVFLTRLIDANRWRPERGNCARDSPSAR